MGGDADLMPGAMEEAKMDSSLRLSSCARARAAHFFCRGPDG